MSGLACACGYPFGKTDTVPPLDALTPSAFVPDSAPGPRSQPTGTEAPNDGRAVWYQLPNSSWIHERLPIMFYPLVQTQSLRKRYGEFEAVADLTLEVQGGEIFALLGPNGA